MTEFFPEIAIREQEVEAIARGLYAVAKADGEVHPRELALISEFYVADHANPADFAALERIDAPTPEGLAQLLIGEGVRLLFVKTALLMAHADGKYSTEEAGQIAAYASAMDIDDKTLAVLDEQVREYLLAQLTHIANVEAVVEVAKELKKS